MKEIHVNLDKRGYPILIEPGLLARVGQILAGLNLSKRIVIVTNPLVGGYYAASLQESLKEAGFNPELIEVPDGEEYKCLDWVSKIYESLVELELDRRCGLIALGGGVIGDLAGFVAATFMRGLPFIQIPTTLLAQVDSSIGGKVGVNLKKGKNLVGAFYQPKVVIIDPTVLKTLNKRELRCGLAEVIKYGVIKNKELFSYLESNIELIINLDLEALVHIIAISCQIKAEIVETDELEAGLRAILNFGHTVGHGIETLTGYTRYHHGEAVSIGMVVAANLSQAKGMLDSASAQRIKDLIQQAGLPTACPELKPDEIWQALMLDKKRLDNRIRFILPTSIGQVVIDEGLFSLIRGCFL